MSSVNAQNSAKFSIVTNHLEQWLIVKFDTALRVIVYFFFFNNSKQSTKNIALVNELRLSLSSARES